MILMFCRSGDHHFRNFFTINPFNATHDRVTAAPGLAAGQSASQMRPMSVPKTPLSRLSPVRSPPPPFPPCRGTYLPKFGMSDPPPPPFFQFLFVVSLLSRLMYVYIFGQFRPKTNLLICQFQIFSIRSAEILEN